MSSLQKTFIGISLILNLISIGWIISVESGQRSVKLKTAEIYEIVANTVRADKAMLGETQANKIEAVDESGVYAVMNRSRLTKSGAIAFLGESEKQAVLISEGVIALLPTSRENEKNISDAISSYQLVASTSVSGGTIKILGKNGASLIINSGDTLSDPLDILGANLTLRSPTKSLHIDASGIFKKDR